MVNLEAGRNIFNRTVGSERFEHYSRNKLVIAASVLAFSVGIGAAQILLDDFSSLNTGRQVFFTVEAGAGLSAPVAIVTANIRSRLRRRDNLNKALRR